MFYSQRVSKTGMHSKCQNTQMMLLQSLFYTLVICYNENDISISISKQLLTIKNVLESYLIIINCVIIASLLVRDMFIVKLCPTHNI